MSILYAVAALAAAAGGAPATRTVAVGDLDLSRPADVAKLDRRLTAAARKVCAEPGSAVFGSYAASKTCERATKRALTAQREAAVQAAKGVALAAR